jgi:acyl dehydratase
MSETFSSIEDLEKAQGRTLGPGIAIRVDQEMIDAFAAVTQDRQWIHLDRDRMRSRGGTIAHGLLTLSLITALTADVFAVDTISSVNYGFDKVRFLGPVTVDTNLTAIAVIDRVDPGPRGTKVRSLVTVYGAGEPVCVAHWWTFYPDLTLTEEPT